MVSGRAYVVAQVVQLAVLFLVDDLLVAQCREGLRVPIDHAHAPVDEAFVVEVAEDVDDAAAAHLVHGEGRAVPVARRAQAAQLLEDDAAVLLRPRPGVLEELLAGEVGLADALLCQLGHHLGFGGDGGVVGAGHPAGVLAHHAGAAHQHVLDGVVEHVPHVQHARDVGRRDDDRVRLAPVRGGVKQLVVQPVLVPLRLDVGRIVFACQFHIDRVLGS